MANFLEDLEKSPFITDFDPPAPPEGSQSLTDDTLVPPVAWAFPLSLTIKSTEERTAKAEEKAKAKDPKNAGAKAQAQKAATDASTRAKEGGQ